MFLQIEDLTTVDRVHTFPKQKQKTLGVEVFRINVNDQWVLQEYKTLQETVQLPSVSVSVSMQEIYRGTRLAKVVN